MAQPSIVVHTFPRNSSQELHVWLTDHSVSPSVPLTTGTVTLVVRDVNGTQIGSFNGTHVADGEWEINVAPLNQSDGTIAQLIVTAAKGGNSNPNSWWARLIDPEPPLAP